MKDASKTDPLRFKTWLAQLAWTPECAEAFAQLEHTATVQSPRAEDLYPPRARVQAWLEAAFVDNALACAGKKERQLTPRMAITLGHHLIGGMSWSWSNSKRPDQDLSPRDLVRSQATLFLALTENWDKTAAALGSKPLARKVVAKKTYDGAAFAGLVRHCATAAKNKLGEGSCQPALKAWAARPQTDFGVLLALACLAIEGAGGHPRAEVAKRLEALLTEDGAAPVKAAPALVEDAQASVFERYLPVLDDAKSLAALKKEKFDQYTPTTRMVEAWVFGFDDAVSTLLTIPQLRSNTLPNGRLIAAAALGKPEKGWRELLRADLKRFHEPRQVKKLSIYRWSTEVAAIALAAGDTKLVLKLTVGAKKEVFKPGKKFGEDARKVLRYFACAIDAKAKQVDVTPAWLELLVARVPRDYDDTLAGGAWSWASLLCLAYAYFHLIGGAPEGEVAKRLRDTLRGVRDP